MWMKPMALEQVLSDRDSEDEVDDDVADLEDRRVSYKNFSFCGIQCGYLSFQNIIACLGEVLYLVKYFF